MKLMLKRLVIITLICLICSSNLQVYAALDFATSEASVSSGSTPVTTPGTPGGGSGSGGSGGPSSERTEDTVPRISISYNYAINGLVYEDEISYVEVTDSAVGIPTTYKSNDGIYNDGEPVVSGVQVLNKQGSSYASLTTTDSNGNFSISVPGEYNLALKYGFASTSGNDYKKNKDTLKYNGQDYKMLTTTSSSLGMERLEYLLRIKELRKSYTEVMILIDYSNSMRENSNKKLNIVKASAKEFVNRLFDEAEGNIAVGFMAFSYDGCVVKSPTDVKEDVLEGINNFAVENSVAKYSGEVVPIWGSLNSGSGKTGTNIGAAVLKAKTAYLGAESNKVMVLFSDGAATAHKDLSEPIYSDDSESVIRNKLNIVADKTREDLKSIVDSGISLISILNDTTDPDELYYINKAFSDGANSIGTKYTVGFDDREAVEEALLNDVKEKVEETLGQELTIPDSEIIVVEGDDNADRRQALNDYYKKINYDKLKIFAVIDKLNGNFNNDINQIAKYKEIDISEKTLSEKKNIYNDFFDSNEVQKFMQNNYMVAENSQNIRLYELTYDSNGHYKTIERPGEVLYRFTYSPAYNVYDDDGEVIDRVGEGYYINGTRFLKENISITSKEVKFQAALVKRSEFALGLEKKITGVRLTLSDGSVIYKNVATMKNGDNTISLTSAIKEYNELVKGNYQQLLQVDEGKIDASEVSIDVKNNWTINEVEEYVPETVTLTADTNLLQGATLEVEYTFVINNNSASDIISKSLSIVDYYDNGLVYRPEGKLISENSTNSDYGWKERKTSELSVNDKAKKYEKKCVYVNYNENEYKNAEKIGNDLITINPVVSSKYLNPRIGSGGKRYAKIVLSVVLSAEIIEDFVYRNQAEILDYSNSRGRRMNYTEELPSGRVVYRNPISGNYVPTKAMNEISNYDAISNVKEIDTVLANRVRIIPPTGLLDTKKGK